MGASKVTIHPPTPGLEDNRPAFSPSEYTQRGWKEYKKMGQKEVELTECSLKIVSRDRAVVVKLN